MSEKLIALDIGHDKNTFPPSKGRYYDDNGAKKEFHEHDFNSAVGAEMGKLLKQNGFKVLMTQQPNGDYVSLQDRVNKANNANADLFFSIHADYNGNNHGHWCFYWHNSAGGKKLAQLVSDETTKTVGTPPQGNGIYPCTPNTWSNFYVVANTKMEAVLHEHDFFSNDMVLKKYLISPKYQKLYAEANVRAICRYYGKAFKTEEKVEVAEVEENNVSPRFKESYEWITKEGLSDGSKPKAPITREQFFAILYRYHGKFGDK